MPSSHLQHILYVHFTTMAILFSLAGLAKRLLATVYVIKYLPPGHLSELCAKKILSPSRFHHLLCVLHVFVLHVIGFACAESTSPSHDGIVTCGHLWGIQMQMRLCMENFCLLPINSHLLLISTFFLTMPIDSNKRCVRHNWFSPYSFMKSKVLAEFLVKNLFPVSDRLYSHASQVSDFCSDVEI